MIKEKKVVAVLHRIYFNDRTEGILMLDNLKRYDTLELPNLDNQTGISCIPEGTYEYIVDYSNNKKRNVIELINVKDRSQIQIHSISKITQLKGCIGVYKKAIESEIFEYLKAKNGLIKIKNINKI